MLLLSTATKTLTIYDTMSSAADEVTRFLDSILQEIVKDQKNLCYRSNSFSTLLEFELWRK